MGGGGGGGSARRDSGSESREVGTPRDAGGRAHRDRAEQRADRLRRRSDEPRTNGQTQVGGGDGPAGHPAAGGTYAASTVLGEAGGEGSPG